MALNPDLSGDPVSPRFKKLPPPIDPLTADALGPLDEAAYWQEMETIERDYMIGLQMRYGSDYIYHIDPFRMHLADLVEEDRQNLTSRIDELTGAKGLWEQGIGPTMFRDYLTPDQTRFERSPAGRMVFHPSEFMKAHIDPRVLHMSQQTIRFDRSKEAVTAEQYYSAGTQYRPRVMQHIQQLLEGGIQTPGKTFVFDIETPGLDPTKGFWEISGQMLTPEGMEAVKTWRFKNKAMQAMGVIGPQAQSLEDYLAPDAGEFVPQIKDFLSTLLQAENVGGHNIFFDYGMIARGIRNNPAYRSDPEYRSLVDAFYKKFYDKETNKLGNVIDTNVLARNIIPEIDIAQELRHGPTPYQFSLQNILLQTDLLNKIKRQEGDETVSNWLTKGLHYAEIDVPMESHLLRALQQHQLWLTAQGGEELQMGDFLSPEERRRIIQSRAIGPNIAISKMEHIHPALIDRATAAGLIEGENIHLTPLDQMVALQRRLTAPLEQPSLYRSGPTLTEQLRNRNLGGIFARLKKVFWDVDTDETALDLTHKTNMWARYSKDFITKGGLIKGAPQDYERFQEELQQANIPYAGLSWVERHVASLLGEVASDTDAEGKLRQVFGADVASLGMFQEAPKLAVVGKSKIATVPLQYLQGWNPERFSETDFMAHLSPFLHDRKHKKEIGLMYMLNAEERESLLHYIGTRLDPQQDKELLDSLADAFRINSGTYGIQLGTLGGLEHSNLTAKIYDALQDISGIGADVSDQTPMFSVQVLGKDILGKPAGRIYTGGAFLRHELMTEEERASLASNALLAKEKYISINRDFRNDRLIGYLSNIKRIGADSQDLDRTLRGWTAAQNIAKRAPVVTLAAALLGGSYYIHKKHERTQIYNQTFAAQPGEAPGWYDRNQRQDIPRNPQRSPDYLATARVVSNLDANKIGHTNMAPDKYGYLFSTGY